jgi:hypothetical protein
MRPFASTPAARTKDTVIWSFNRQNCSYYNLNWINVRRSQKNGPMLFFIKNVFYTWKYDRVTWNCCKRNFRKDFVISHHLNTTLYILSTFDVAKAEESLQMELLEMQSDSTPRAKYLEVGISGFFSYLPEKFKNFRKFATRIMAMFGFTYVCEQLFSLMKSTKTSQITRLTDQHLSSLIKVGTAQTFQPEHTKHCH